MKSYEIWSEGWALTGESARAHRLGVMEGEDFKDACLKMAKKMGVKFQVDDKGNVFNWGCQLFDNEKDARESFG